MNMDIPRFSKRFLVRRLESGDVGAIFALCRENPLYYRYHPPFVTERSILEDMRALPPKKDVSDKYYVGYFDGEKLIAVLDLIKAYPDGKTAFIGFFMTDASVRNTGVGSGIIDELCAYLAGLGFEQIELAWVSGNPQASHFWHKNRFAETGSDVSADGLTVTRARRELDETLETDRLRLYPASREQMEDFIAAETDAELKKAYTEMLEGCLQRPEAWPWYAMWMIELKDGTHIGDLCFKGPGADGIPEIGYGILEEYRGRGCASEAVSAACAWAFRHPEVTAVEAETDPDNAASRRVLEKCGFLPNGTVGEEGPRFSLTRERMMRRYEFVTLREMPALKKNAAAWFHSKWGVPESAYLECMDAYLSRQTEYGWYLCLYDGRIVSGLGVIENDFHDRKDLSPNICAVYTDKAHRGRGIAGRLLDMAVEDLRSKGISPVYLVTDHIGFYERYGWEFLCPVRAAGEAEISRMYIRR